MDFILNNNNLPLWITIPVFATLAIVGLLSVVAIVVGLVLPVPDDAE